MNIHELRLTTPYIHPRFLSFLPAYQPWRFPAASFFSFYSNEIILRSFRCCFNRHRRSPSWWRAVFRFLLTSPNITFECSISSLRSFFFCKIWDFAISSFLLMSQRVLDSDSHTSEQDISWRLVWCRFLWYDLWSSFEWTSVRFLKIPSPFSFHAIILFPDFMQIVK